MRSNEMCNVLRNAYKINVPISRYFSTPVSGIDYCANIVRQHDYENYLATLLTTKAIRTPALVVRAFNVEVARVQDQTTDPHTTAFRLQFWQDLLTSIYKKDQDFRKIPANPVAKELFKVCHSYNLPRRHLEKLITSRHSLAKSKHFHTLEDMESYAEHTVSTIYYLLLCIAGVANVHADHVASHLGKAQGITNILRQIANATAAYQSELKKLLKTDKQEKITKFFKPLPKPSIHVSNHHKVVSLPMDVLMKNKISQEDVLRGVDNDNMRNVIFEVATRAKMHLQKARSIAVPKITNQIFLPATSVDIYLTKLQKNNFHVFDKSLQKGSPMLPFNLYFKRLLNKY